MGPDLQLVFGPTLYVIRCYWVDERLLEMHGMDSKNGRDNNVGEKTAIKGHAAMIASRTKHVRNIEKLRQKETDSLE